MGFFDRIFGRETPKPEPQDEGLENRRAADAHYERMMAKAREDQTAAEQMGIDRNANIEAGMAEEGLRQMQGEGIDHGDLDLKAGKPDAMRAEYQRVAAEQKLQDMEEREAAADEAKKEAA